MGKTRIIAETRAGQHGGGNRHGLRALWFAMHRLYGRAMMSSAKPPIVFRYALAGGRSGARGRSGRGTLKDAMNDALRDWVTNVHDTFYCIGTVAGPHPYPAMVA